MSSAQSFHGMDITLNGSKQGMDESGKAISLTLAHRPDDSGWNSPLPPLYPGEEEEQEDSGSSCWVSPLSCPTS